MKRRTVFALWTFLAVACIAVTAAVSARLGSQYDLPLFVERADRVFKGELPYRDFTCIVAPMTFFMQGALFKIFGPVDKVWIIFIALQNLFFCAAAIAAIKMLWRWPTDKLLWVAPVIFLWSPGLHFPLPWYDLDPFAFAWLELFCALWAVRRSSVRPLLIAGVFAMLSFFAKQNVGGAALLGGALFCALSFPTTSARCKALGAYLLGAAVVAGIFIAIWAHAGALHDMREWLFSHSYANQVAIRGTLFARFLEILFSPTRKIVKLVIALYTLGILAALHLDLKFREKKFLALPALLLGAGTMLAGCISQSGGNFPYQQAFFGLALAACLEWLGRLGPSSAKKYLQTGLVLGCVVFALYFQKVTKLWAENPVRLPTSAFAWSWGPENLAEALSIWQKFDQQIPPGERVFVLPNQLYCFAFRRPYGGWVSAFEFRGQEISHDDLEKEKNLLIARDVRWAVVDTSYIREPEKAAYFAPVTAYLLDNFTVVEERLLVSHQKNPQRSRIYFTSFSLLRKK